MRRRLLFSYLSLTVFVLIALGVPLGLSFANTEQRRLENDVEHDAFALSQRVGSLAEAEPSQATSALKRVVEQYRDQTGAHVLVVDETGAAIVRTSSALHSRTQGDVVSALNGRDVTVTRTDPAHGDMLIVAVPVFVRGQIDGAVLVAVPEEVVSDRVARNWLLLGGLGGVIALVVLLVSTLLARSFTRPLAELDRGASRLGDGDLAARVPVPDDPPELRGLAQSFNATAARLETLVRSQQSFVADASHQLRTPLAALRLRLENLEAEAPELAGEDLDRALAEVRRLSQLVDSLLLLARAEQPGRVPEPVGLDAVVDDRRDAWSALASERAVRLVVEAEPVVVRSVPGRLEQVLDNVLNNALEVAPPGTAVRMVVRRDGDRGVLEVRDAGPGMTPEQRRRAFDRFWRAHPSQRDGGFGLGLAIVRQLVDADGGEVTLDDAPEGGLAVTVRLPLANVLAARG